MAEGSIPIRHTDPSQERDTLQQVAAEVSGILTPGEEILYIALQNRTAGAGKLDSVIATSKRLIFYRAKMLGRFEFADFPWHDVQDVHINPGMLATDFVMQSIDGRSETLGGPDKEQAKRLYSITQQLEEEWREKRRQRQLEETRAQAGGVHVTIPQPTAGSTEDPVARLARAKALLEENLISVEEYKALRERILSSI